jgi:hypothetical protein
MLYQIYCFHTLGSGAKLENIRNGGYKLEEFVINHDVTISPNQVDMHIMVLTKIRRDNTKK